MDRIVNGKKQRLALSRRNKTSLVLKEILRDLPDTEVRIGDVVVRLRRRSFGGLLILSAALGILPGISILAGIVMVASGLQLFAGFRTPLLPKIIRNHQIETSLVAAIGQKCISLVEPIERFVKPRFLILTTPPMLNLIGLIVAALGVVIMLPLPFSNLPPAIALLIISAGLLEHDGLMIVIGIIVAAFALTVGWFVSYIAIESLLGFFESRGI